jgi:hypothetical protein
VVITLGGSLPSSKMSEIEYFTKGPI